MQYAQSVRNTSIFLLVECRALVLHDKHERDPKKAHKSNQMTAEMKSAVRRSSRNVYCSAFQIPGGCCPVVKSC